MLGLTEPNMTLSRARGKPANVLPSRASGEGNTSFALLLNMLLSTVETTGCCRAQFIALVPLGKDGKMVLLVLNGRPASHVLSQHTRLLLESCP